MHAGGDGVRAIYITKQLLFLTKYLLIIRLHMFLCEREIACTKFGILHFFLGMHEMVISLLSKGFIINYSININNL